MKAPFKGQTKKDGYGILHDSFQQARSAKKLYNSNTTEFIARVILVVMPTEPGERYFIFAKRQAIDVNTSEPEIFSKEYIREEHIVGLKRYYPASEDIEVPVIGQWIRVGITHEQSQIGTYLGPNKKFNKKDVLGTKQGEEQNASKSFEEKQ